jgi:crotonobetainyl-CoA:carnitine CoA-transferase CaiB-like acyl-CoA transferase
MPNSAHPSLVPFQNFKAADGWIVVACAKEKFWKRLAVAIGRPELAEDERYESFSVRRENSNDLLKILDEVFVTQTCEYWLSVLAEAGVPVGPVYNVEQALADPHTIARGLIVETDHHRFGRVKQLASPVNFGTQPREYRRAPIRNEDFDYVMNEILEYSPEHIHELGQLGAFGVVHDSRKSQEHSDTENVR